MQRALVQGLQWPFFWFPYNVNYPTVRCTAVLVFTLCILGAVFADRREGQWIAAALLADFFLRFVAGGRATPLGALGDLLAFALERVGVKERELIPSPPKQFATFVGLFFALMATIFAFVPLDEDDRIGPRVILAMLAGASGLEGFAAICLGCLFFTHALIRIGLVSSSVNAPSEEQYDSAVATWAHVWESSSKPVPPMPKRCRLDLGNEADPTKRECTYRWKRKDDDQLRLAWHPVRHAHVSLLACCMACAAPAAYFRAARGLPSSHFAYSEATSWVLLGISIAITAAFVALYAVKAFAFPRRIAKEWLHQYQAPMFAGLPIVVLLYAMFALPWTTYEGVYDPAAAPTPLVPLPSPPAPAPATHPFVRYEDSYFTTTKVLFWIGTPLSLLFGVVGVGRWIAELHGAGSPAPGWLIGPLSTLVAAAVAAFIPHYGDTAMFLFAVGVGMYGVLLPIIVWRLIVAAALLQPPMRSTMSILAAAPAMAAVAAFAISIVPEQSLVLPSDDAAALTFGPRYPGMDSVALFFFFFAQAWLLVLFYLLAVGFLVRVEPRFKPVAFSYAFSWWVMAFAALFAYERNPSSMYKVMLYAYVVAACWVTMHCLLLFVQELARGYVFVAEEKFGPLAINKMWHYTFRDAFDDLRRLSKRLKADSAESQKKFSDLFSMIVLLHTEHAAHEEYVMFPVYREIWPGVTESADAEHVRDFKFGHEMLEKTQRLLADDTSDADKAKLVDELKDNAAQFMNHTIEHLDNEELNLQALPRKFVCPRRQVSIVRAMWKKSAPEVWHKMLPFMLNTIKLHQRRVQLLRGLVWAMPERAFLIGYIVYTGCSPTLCRQLFDQIPEIIPRPLVGWTRNWH